MDCVYLVFVLRKSGYWLSPQKKPSHAGLPFFPVTPVILVPVAVLLIYLLSVILHRRLWYMYSGVYLCGKEATAKVICDWRTKNFRSCSIESNMSRPEHQAPPEIVCCIFILRVDTDCFLVLWRYRSSEIHFKVMPLKFVPNLSSRIQQVQAEMVRLCLWLVCWEARRYER